MKEETEKADKEKKRLRPGTFPYSALFLEFGLFDFSGVGFFTLGVLAGRGLLPSGAKTLAELKNQILKLQEMVGQKDTSELDEIKAVQKDSKFAFLRCAFFKKSFGASRGAGAAAKKPQAHGFRIEKCKKA